MEFEDTILEKINNKYITHILIVIPYGDLNPDENREEQLRKFLAHFRNILYNTCPSYIQFHIIISEQITPKKYFNRGQIINIGIKYFVDNVCVPNTVIFQDVDIIPNTPLFKEYYNLSYDSYSIIPYKSPTYKETYNYKLTAGSAIYSIKYDIFKEINGFPNNFFGYGGEDHAFNNRLLGLTGNKDSKKYNTFFNRYIGDFISTDNIRTDYKNKINYVKKKKIRNMMVYELLDEDKINSEKNGYNNLSNLTYTINRLPNNLKYAKKNVNWNIIHIQVNLDETDLIKTIEHNKIIYKKINRN